LPRSGLRARLRPTARCDRVHNFTFEDVEPWPAAADGSGHSREVANFFGDYNSGANWQASATAGGAPGQTAASPGDLSGNGLVDGSDVLRWQPSFGLLRVLAAIL
jgi:hypothetical protein